MEGLLSYLIFAGLFYLMMRYGCGAHMLHGHGHGHGGEEVNHADPVCGMKVNPKSGYGKVYKGTLYRFCSRNCLDKFEEEPEKYLTQSKEESES